MTRNLLLMLATICTVSSCTKDRDTDINFTPVETVGEYVQMHVWDFNQEKSMDGLLIPSFSFDFAILEIQANEWDDTEGTSVNLLNSMDSVLPGNALRVRNPSERMDIIFSTMGYGSIRISYAGMRTNNGAKNQQLSYSTDGVNFSSYGIQNFVLEPDTDWKRFEIDLKTVPALANIPMAYFRITFTDGNTGESGNNRFDNIIVEGRKLSE